MTGVPRLMPVPHEIHPFDVYRMPVRFEEDKTRSRNHYVVCIVVQTDGDGGVAVKLTSNPKWDGDGDLHLLDWKEAGLTHATTARCAQLVRFTRDQLQGYVGVVSHEDAVRILHAIQRVPPNRQVWL